MSSHRAVTTVLVATVLLGTTLPTRAPAEEVRPTKSISARELIDAYRAARNADESEDVLVRIEEEAIDGQILFANDDDRAEFAALLVEQSETPDGHVPWDLLRRYWHSSAASSVVKIAMDPKDEWDRSSACRLLASVAEPRLISILATVTAEANSSDEAYAAYQEDFYEEYRGGFVVELLTRYPQPESLPILETWLAGATDAADRKRLGHALERQRLRIEVGLDKAFDLADEHDQRLDEVGFVIVPEERDHLYEFLDTDFPFVTSDIALNTFLLQVDRCVTDLEKLVLVPVARSFLGKLAKALVENARSTTADRGALWDAATVVSVGAELLDPRLRTPNLPPDLAKSIAEELDRIRAAATTQTSPILGFDVDYRRFRPRARHSDQPQLADYYRAMVWLKTCRDGTPDGVRRAIEVVGIIAQDETLQREWTQLDSVIGLLFGRRVHASVPEYASLAREVVGPEFVAADWDRLRSDGELSKRFVSLAAGRGRQFSLLGERHSPSAERIQQLIQGGEWPPTGLLVARDVLGSTRAGEILSTERPGVQGSEFPLPPPEEPRSLEEGILTCARVLFDVPRSAPRFMQGAPWQDKCVNTALGAWAEVRHGTQLYSTEAHTTIGGELPPLRFHGAVEPNPRFFARLATFVDEFDRHLEQAGLYRAIEAEQKAERAAIHAQLERLRAAEAAAPDERESEIERLSGRLEWLTEDLGRVDPTRMTKLAEVLRQCEALAEKTLTRQPQDEEDARFLRNIADTFDELAYEPSETENTTMSKVVDIATELRSGQVAHAAIGRPWAIYVLVPAHDGTVQMCRGGVYTYYEFTTENLKRLSDQEWRAMNSAESRVHLPWIVR